MSNSLNIIILLSFSTDCTKVCRISLATNVDGTAIYPMYRISNGVLSKGGTTQLGYLT